MLRTISVVNPIPKTVTAAGAATPAPSVAQAPVKVDVSKIAASNKPARGTTTGKNIIYLYSDFQCPYCARGEEVMKEVLAKHPTDTKVYFKNYPLTNLHPQAYPTALAAECANEQGKFWEFADYTFAHQDLLTQVDTNGASIGALTIAKAVGIADLTKFAECVGSQKYKSVVDAEAQEAASLGLQGTPGFIVVYNGNKEGFVISGAYPAETFEQYLK
jgi:protein-disulfide isomerase